MKHSLRRIFLVTATVCGTLPAAQIYAQQSAHEHGAVSLNFALDGNQLLVEVRSPAINFFGFEHKPSSDEDKKVVMDGLDKLRSAESLFILNGEAGCAAASAEAEHVMQGDHDEHEHDKDDEHEHEEHEHDEHEHEEGAVHSEVHADYMFECATPGELVAMSTSLYDHFPGIDRIDYQGALPGGQVSGTLSPEATTIKLK